MRVHIKTIAHNRVSVGPLKDQEGKEVKESKEIADLLATHYSSVFKVEFMEYHAQRAEEGEDEDNIYLI